VSREFGRGHRAVGGSARVWTLRAEGRGSLAAIGASPHETHSLRQNARHGTVFSCYVSTKLCGGIAKDGGRLRPAILRSAGIPRPLATGPHEALALAGTGMRPGRRYEHLVRVPRHPHPRRWPASHARVSALPRLFATGSAALGIAAPAREHPLAVRQVLLYGPLVRRLVRMTASVSYRLRTIQQDSARRSGQSRVGAGSAKPSLAWSCRTPPRTDRSQAWKQSPRLANFNMRKVRAKIYLAVSVKSRMTLRANPFHL